VWVFSRPNGISKHPLTGLFPENVVRLVDEIGLKTLRDQLIFWSDLGRADSWIKLSQEFARTHGGMTLEMTPVGKWLNKTNLYSPNSPFTLSQADKI
jgi:hypothetical protein